MKRHKKNMLYKTSFSSIMSLKMTTTTAKARYYSSTTTATRYYSTTNDDGQGHINKRGEVMIFSNANEDSATNKHHQHPRNRYHYQSPVIYVSLTCYFLVLPFLWRKEGYTSQSSSRGTNGILSSARRRRNFRIS